MAKTFFKSRVFSCVALLVMFAFSSCESDPLKAEMEKYAKEHMAVGTPDTYEFESMGLEKKDLYIEELERYKQSLKKNLEKDPERFQKEIEKVEELQMYYAGDAACYERVLYFFGKSEGGTKIPQMVFAIYDENGNILHIGMSRAELPKYPALKMLEERGEINIINFE